MSFSSYFRKISVGQQVGVIGMLQMSGASFTIDGPLAIVSGNLIKALDELKHKLNIDIYAH